MNKTEPAGIRRALRRAGLIGASVAGGMAAAGAAIAQPMNFPPSLEREALLGWLTAQTDIQPQSVVAVTSQALTAVVSTFPAGGGQGPRVVLRAEALNAETYARTGALSWHVSLSADCAGHKVKLGDTTGYPERNLLGDRKLLRPAEPDWRAPEGGTALDAAWRAACEKDFKGPFQETGVQLAQPDARLAAAAERPGTAEIIQTAARMETPAAPPQAAGREGATSVAAQNRPAVAPAPASRLATAGAPTVQIGAAQTEDDARSMLREVGTGLGGREAWIEQAQVAGRTWHRAIVGGFADAADAARFCAGLKAGGHDCFVRPLKRS